VSKYEIEQLYGKLRQKGYGEEEARRRYDETLRRIQNQRRLAERRRRRVGGGDDDFVGRRRGADPIAEPSSADAESPKRRVEDFLPEVPPKLRRRINKWAFRNGFLICGLRERLADVFSYFNPQVIDGVNPRLLRLLVVKRGYLGDNPYNYTFIDNLDALYRSARVLLGKDSAIRRTIRPGERRSLEDDVRQSMEIRDPFGLRFLERFTDPETKLRRSLEFLDLRHLKRERIEVTALARVVKDAYRLIIATENVEPDKLSQLLDTAKDVCVAHRRTRRAVTETEELAFLFRIAFANLQKFRHELYPALLKMLGVFYPEEDESTAKHERLLSFLQLSEDDIMTFRHFEQRLNAERERRMLEERKQEVEALEQQKSENFAERFRGILGVLAAMFPGSEIDRMDQGAYILPYFDDRVFTRTLVFPHQMPNVEVLSRTDPFSVIIVLHRIVDNLLNSIHEYNLEGILGKEELREHLVEIKRQWKNAYFEIFEGYLKALEAYQSELDSASSSAGRRSRLTMVYEEEIYQHRNAAIRDYGRMVSPKEAIRGVHLYQLAQDLNDVLVEVGEEINQDLVRRPNPIANRTYQELATRQVVHFELHADPSLPDYKPVTRQVKRYIEAKHHTRIEEIPHVAQIDFVDIARGMADMYAYLLNDEASFLRAMGSTTIVFADTAEEDAWDRERNAKTSRSLEALRVQLGESSSGEYVDELTKMRNKNYFLKELPKKFEKFRREKREFTILLMDIDHFKWINDSAGHQVGDDVLRITAEMILDSVREHDLVVRFGGEEILVFVADSLHSGIVLGERLRYNQEELVQKRPAFEAVRSIREAQTEPCGTLSIGVAPSRGCSSLDEVVSRADRTLYTAKETRNRVVYYDLSKEKGEKTPMTTYEEYLRQLR
jgi:diguanylate cyclase (GGDEF)-like protein